MTLQAQGCLTFFPFRLLYTEHKQNTQSVGTVAILLSSDIRYIQKANFKFFIYKSMEKANTYALYGLPGSKSFLEELTEILSDMALQSPRFIIPRYFNICRYDDLDTLTKHLLSMLSIICLSQAILEMLVRAKIGSLAC